MAAYLGIMLKCVETLESIPNDKPDIFFYKKGPGAGHLYFVLQEQNNIAKMRISARISEKIQDHKKIPMTTTV